MVQDDRNPPDESVPVDEEYGAGGEEGAKVLGGQVVRHLGQGGHWSNNPLEHFHLQHFLALNCSLIFSLAEKRHVFPSFKGALLFHCVEHYPCSYNLCYPAFHPWACCLPHLPPGQFAEGGHGHRHCRVQVTCDKRYQRYKGQLIQKRTQA